MLSSGNVAFFLPGVQTKMVQYLMNVHISPKRIFLLCANFDEIPSDMLDLYSKPLTFDNLVGVERSVLTRSFISYLVLGW